MYDSRLVCQSEVEVRRRISTAVELAPEWREAAVNVTAAPPPDSNRAEPNEVALSRQAERLAAEASPQESMPSTPGNDQGAPALPPAEEEVYLVIEPVADPCQVLRFCQSVRGIEGAQIAFFSSSHKNATIKLVLMKSVPVLGFLEEMASVARAGEERNLEGNSEWDIPPFIVHHPEKAIHVTLKIA